MPFKKVSKDKYKSPSGRTMTGKQVKGYYAKEGAKKPKAKSISKRKASTY